MTLLRFARPPIQPPDWQTRTGITMAQRLGRSWWGLRYTDGRIFNEWEPDPGSPNGHNDWPRLPFSGRQELRLYCPNGQRPTLGSTGDNTGRLFQYKVALRTVGPSFGQSVLAHVIGMIRDDGNNGECICYAWEPLPEPVVPPGAPVRPQAPSPLCSNPSEAYAKFRAEQSVWVDEDRAWQASPEYQLWKVQHAAWEASRGGRVVGPWDDNVNCIVYHNSGKLAFDVLGLKPGEGNS